MKKDLKRDESLLIKSLSKGNVPAFNSLYSKYCGPLYRFSLNCLKSKIEAEEVVQETFIKIWQKRKELKNELSFKSYLFTIAFNNIRKRFRINVRISDVFENHMSNCHDNSTQQTINYNSLYDQLKHLVNKLPDRRKKIFIKSRIKGLSNDEIAREMQLKKKTVENQLSHALRFLREKLVKESIPVILSIFAFTS
jgi:RNA polymerase sigma-70 factor (family 1)